VKQKLAEKFGLTLSEIKLISKGKVLKDHVPINEYKLTATDIINVNLPGGASTKQIVEETKTGGLGSLP